MQSSRAERLFSNSEGMDAIVILNGEEPFLDSTFWYVTEQSSGTFEGAIAIVTSDGKLHVITNILEEETANTGKGEVHVYRTKDEYDGVLKDILKDANKIGVNIHSAIYSTVQHLKNLREDIEIKDATSAIAKTVSVKDTKEIAATEKACKITSTVANELPTMIKEGVTEQEVAARMDNRMRMLGGTGNAFDTIAAFGKNSAMPHHAPNDYKLKDGEVALFDFGSKYNRYCADLTRTIFLGDPGETLRKAYDVVLKAQNMGLEQVHAGANAKDVDLAARKVIDDSEFKGKFIHSFGHGIGMDIHQSIFVSPRSEQVLKEGNIISAEPGVYISGLGGIRIEDTILVTKNGYRKLTDYDHGFTVV
ncbi:MAG: aminopeptidase P family protein [Candidatus Methanomethylophilaceae archaeon]|jgi:Xaa-Pro dipeptidase